MRLIANCLLVFLVFFNTNKIENEDCIETEEINYEPEPEEITGIVNDLHVLHPTFRNKVITLIYECKLKGITLKIVETYRTPERQDSLKRRKLTFLSGGKSKHQHYLAIDVVPIVNGKAEWHDQKLWNQIGKIGEAQGLTWGGRWRKLKDYCHFEYPITIDKISTVSLPDTILIPLNEEEWK